MGKAEGEWVGRWRGVGGGRGIKAVKCVVLSAPVPRSAGQKT